MVLTATELAQKLLELSPFKPVAHVSNTIRKFLGVGDDIRLQVLKEGERFRVCLPTPDGLTRWVWTVVEPESVTLFRKWGDIIDDHPFRKPTPGGLLTADSGTERVRRRIPSRRYNTRRSRGPADAPGDTLGDPLGWL